ncbi:SGNH/GDSL hydrolase family protein [Candidatus Zixiibacteriota bacterium]
MKKRTTIFTIVLASILLCATSYLSAEQAEPQDDGVVWHDATQLTLEGKGWADTESPYDRLPAKAKDMVRETVWNLSRHSAGLRIRFTSDATFIKVRWTLIKEALDLPHMPATGVSGIDLYGRDKNGEWRFVANGRPKELSNEAEFKLLPNTEHALYLPLYNGVTQVEMGAYRTRSFQRSDPSPEEQEKLVVFYGTSITQGACASRPGMASTAIAGRRLDVPVINLGFSGNGRMELELAELLGELDPAVFVLDCLWNMTPEMVSERVEPFVTTLRGYRPETPIVLVEDCSFLDQPTQDGDILRAIYQKLKAQGDENLHLLPNTGMLGSDSEGTVDNCHPNDLGMMRQALSFVEFLEPLLEERE